MQEVAPYKPKNKIRIVTAASLFDGHDAAINIMRRIIQATGCEVIHLGHDRSVEEVVNTAIQEDAQAIAMTSYQGGHNEYFKYMYDLLKEKGAGHIRIFGGGGGVILPEEIKELMDYGITRIYSPDDGRAMGLQGMINDMVKQCDFPTGQNLNGEVNHLKEKDVKSIARVISAAENYPEESKSELDKVHQLAEAVKTPVLGITGTGGAGKSSLVDELVRRFLIDFKEKRIGIISVDPSKRKTGGALLGDRIRMNSINNPRVYMRSLATRQSNLALSKHVREAVQVLKAAEYDLIILETSGIGQSDTEILDHRVGEQLLAHVGQRGIAGIVGHVEFDRPPHADIFNALETKPFEGMVDGATLRIENAGLERDMDADLHRGSLSFGAPMAQARRAFKHRARLPGRGHASDICAALVAKLQHR